MEIELQGAGEPEAVAALNGMLAALQGALRLPPERSPQMDAQIDMAFAAYDRYIAHVTARHPMSCRAGCTACCHDNPHSLSGLEQRRLSAWIGAQPDGAALRARFAALAAEGEGVTQGAWRARGRACPLLSEGPERHCRAYALRPVACRAFHAMTPAAWCSPGDPRYPERVNPHLDPPAVLLLALKVLSARLGLPEPSDLHRAMRAGGASAGASAGATPA